MRRKAFSNVPAEWEKPYLNQPEIPDWKEAVLTTEISDEQGSNEYETLFSETDESTLQRTTATDRKDFLKKDNIKIATEIRSRLDRFLSKSFKYQVIESKREDSNITCFTQLTEKVKNGKTIVAEFIFTITKPKFLSATVSSEKVEASGVFKCNNEEFPLTKRGFEIAFSKHGRKFADSTVISTMYQLEEQYSSEDIINGVDNGDIVPLSEKVYICKASYLNSLKIQSKQASIDTVYTTERHNEQDSDSSLRVGSQEKKEQLTQEAKKEAQFRYYSEQNLQEEIKREFGLAKEESDSLILEATNKGIMLSVPGGYIIEDSFASLVKNAGIISENKLKNIINETSKSHISSKIQGEYRLDAEKNTSKDNLLLQAKSRIDGKNKILSHEINQDKKVTLVKVSTSRVVSGYEIPVDYFLCFNDDGYFQKGHASIAGKNIELGKLDFFYQALEKEAEKQNSLENRPADFAQQPTTLDHDSSYITDDTRLVEKVADTEKFTKVKNKLKESISSSVSKNLLTNDDVEIFHKRINLAKQISELTQIEREFKTLTDIGGL